MTPRHRRIVILTGAGISAESGLGTFRDENGLWTKVKIEDVATPEAFARDPERVRGFYNARRAGVLAARPNDAHRALARLEADYAGRGLGEVLVVTQNVDDLHEKAGSRALIHMHGELAKMLCMECGTRHPWTEDLTAALACPACGTSGRLRPDVVWFGEMPYAMDEIEDRLAGCDLFVSIGTSGVVYPAAGFVMAARRAGARTLELNLEPSDGASMFHEAVHGPASAVVPAWVDRMLAA